MDQTHINHLRKLLPPEAVISLNEEGDLCAYVEVGKDRCEMQIHCDPALGKAAYFSIEMHAQDFMEQLAAGPGAGPE